VTGIEQNNNRYCYMTQRGVEPGSSAVIWRDELQELGNLVSWVVNSFEQCVIAKRARSVRVRVKLNNRKYVTYLC
jgi:hypothetical protein